MEVLDFVKDVWYLNIFHKEPKQIRCFFVNVFWWTILSWDFFHKCDIHNLIDVIIYVEKTFRELHFQKCGKYFKKKHKITENLKKKKTFFLFSNWRFHVFRHILSNLKLPRNIMVFNKLVSWDCLKEILNYFLTPTVGHEGGFRNFRHFLS